MNLFDVAVVGVATAAAIGGWRFGFTTRLLAWAGVAAGLFVGVQFVPDVVTAFGGPTADGRITVALLFLVFVALLGQALGILAGALFRPRRAEPVVDGDLEVDLEGDDHRPRPRSRRDRAAGAALGAIGVLVLVWMIVPALTAAPGWPARAARGSRVVGLLDRFAPEQPDAFASWGRSVAEAPYPAAIRPDEEPPEPGPPPEVTLPPPADALARAATVRVSGRACDRVQEGTGWVVERDLVVTNAHVVAGERGTTVHTPDGDERDAVVVAFDPGRDLALLRVDDLGLAPLESGDAKTGDLGAVYGHPRGGPLRVAPARVGEHITAVGTDIYRTGESRRDVLVLAVELEPGDSGAPFVDDEGRVLGTAFAIDPATPTTAYAVTRQELEAVLDGAGRRPVDTGPCVVG